MALGTIPVPQFSSFGDLIAQGRSQQNALTKQNIENQYLGPLMQANALSKTAYAKFLPLQIAGQQLSNPTFQQNAHPEEYKALATQYNAMMNEFLKSQMGATPVSQQPDKFSQSSGGLMDFVKNAIIGGIPNAVSSTQPRTRNELLTNPQGAMQQDQPNIAPVPGQPDTMINRTAASLNPSGAAGGINAPAVNKAQEKAMETSATGEQETYNKMWDERQNNAAFSQKSALNNLNLLDKFEEAYGDLGWFEKGAVLGKYVPAFTNAASDTDKVQAALENDMARAQVEGKVTGIDRKAYGNIKPSRDAPSEANAHLISYGRGFYQRDQEWVPFNIEARKMGLTPPQADAVMGYYARSRPFYNAKTKSVNEDNLNTWPEFLTPQKIKEALDPREQKKTMMDKTASSSSSRTQEKLPPKIGPGATSLSRGLEFPTFSGKTREERKTQFQSWFNGLDPLSQDAVRKKLGGK